MPNVDAIANVIVLAAAGIGAIFAVVCAIRLFHHRESGSDGARLSQGQGG